MKLIVGLGNPGAGYADNRHNIGFMAVDAIHDAWRFGPWKRKFHGQLAEGVVGDRRCLLLKPETFMNRSGLAVGEAAGFYKITPADVVVLHDEIELPPSRLRIKQGGGHAGHNGLKSIDAALGPDYLRIRLGVGRPEAGRAEVHDYVLGDFTKADQAWVDLLCQGLAQQLPLLLAGDHAAVMNRLTLKLRDAGYGI